MRCWRPPLPPCGKSHLKVKPTQKEAEPGDRERQSPDFIIWAHGSSCVWTTPRPLFDPCTLHPVRTQIPPAPPSRHIRNATPSRTSSSCSSSDPCNSLHAVSTIVPNALSSAEKTERALKTINQTIPLLCSEPSPSSPFNTNICRLTLRSCKPHPLPSHLISYHPGPSPALFTPISWPLTFIFPLPGMLFHQIAVCFAPSFLQGSVQLLPFHLGHPWPFLLKMVLPVTLSPLALLDFPS